jgi:hypothetical protein
MPYTIFFSQPSTFNPHLASAVFLDHVTGSIRQMGHVPVAILLIVECGASIYRGIGPHQNFIDPFAIHIARRDRSG